MQLITWRVNSILLIHQHICETFKKIVYKTIRACVRAIHENIYIIFYINFPRQWSFLRLTAVGLKMQLDIGKWSQRRNDKHWFTQISTYFENLQTLKPAGFMSVISINDENFARREGSVFTATASFPTYCDQSQCIDIQTRIRISGSFYGPPYWNRQNTGP